MFNRNIKNKQKIIMAAIFIFVFAAGFGLEKIEKAEAAGVCVYTKITYGESGKEYQTGQEIAKDSEADCKSFCDGTTALFEKYTATQDEAKKYIQATADKSGDNDPAPTSSDVCSWLDWFSSTFFNCLLLKVLTFIGYLVSASATLFEWIIDAENLKSVLNNNIIYTIWGTVRDVLNIAFILVLLFSAFCTVFQVEKFNYKKILLTLIIMALLVNFSFPISRVIIDFSNVIMFSFLKSMGGADSFARIADTGGLAKIINPPTIPDVSYLLAAIVFTFILAVTFMVIAVLMVIRTIALAILIIFSPVAFVGSIVPFLSSKAGAWWDNLFKYSFFGPIMVFMMYIAVEMMNVIALQASSFDNIAKIQTSGDSMAKLVSSYAFFAIPIVILWIGIGTAQTMSIAGASAVVGRGQKFMSWAGKTLTPAGFAMGAWGAYRTRRKEAEKDRWRNRLGAFAGSQQDKLFGVASKDARLRYQRDLSQKVENESKRNDMENKTPDELRRLASSKDKFVRAAALKELANKNALDASGVDKTAYEQMRKEFGTDSQVFNQINNKLKAYDPETAFSHLKSDPANWESAIKAYLNSNQADPKKWSKDVFKNEKILELAFNERAINMDTLLEAKNKGQAYKDNIKDSLNKLATSGKFNLNTDEVHKNIQKAFTAVSGEIADDNFTENIFKTGNKDTLKELKFSVLSSTQKDLFTENINSGKIKEIIQNMSNNQTKRDIVHHFKTSGTLGSNGQSTLKVIQKDVYLDNLA